MVTEPIRHDVLISMWNCNMRNYFAYRFNVLGDKVSFAAQVWILASP